MRLRTHQALAAALLIALAGCSGGDNDAVESNAGGGAYQPQSILQAVLARNEAGVRRFLDRGANPNAAEPDGTTLLMRAVHGRSAAIAKLLIDAGADVSIGNRYGVTPLYLAARAPDPAIARQLLQAGADPNTALPEGETVLMTASKAGSLEIVRALLGQDIGSPLSTIGVSGADIATPEAASGYAAASAPSGANRADPNAKEGLYGQTALMWAAAGGHADIVRTLIRAGANVNAHSDGVDAPEPSPDPVRGGFDSAPIPRGRLTALHFGARDGHLGTVEALVRGGADLNAVDEDGTSALILATLNDHLDVAKFLLEAGADPNVADVYGRTVLFVAVDVDTAGGNPPPAQVSAGELTSVDIVKLALAKGANPNAELAKALPPYSARGPARSPILNKGATPFLLAAISGNLEVMKLLLAAGANPLAATADRGPETIGGVERPSNGGTTPLMAAAGVGWQESISRGRDGDAIKAIQLLLDRGADINAANQSGDTALHGATRRGSTAIIQFLVDHGANLRAKDARGWTPLDIAMGQPEERIPYNEATASLLRRLMKRS
jgi:uncharacterized protein